MRVLNEVKNAASHLFWFKLFLQICLPVNVQYNSILSTFLGNLWSLNRHCSKHYISGNFLYVIGRFFDAKRVLASLESPKPRNSISEQFHIQVSVWLRVTTSSPAPYHYHLLALILFGTCIFIYHKQKTMLIEKTISWDHVFWLLLWVSIS